MDLHDCFQMTLNNVNAREEDGMEYPEGSILIISISYQASSCREVGLSKLYNRKI